MFIAVQMFWGINRGFLWLREGYLLAWLGYRPLFWVLILFAFLVDGLGLSGVLNMFGYDARILAWLGF
jgi:hypothetical protein